MSTASLAFKHLVSDLADLYPNCDWSQARDLRSLSRLEVQIVVAQCPQQIVDELVLDPHHMGYSIAQGDYFERLGRHLDACLEVCARAIIWDYVLAECDARQVIRDTTVQDRRALKDGRTPRQVAMAEAGVPRELRT